MAFPEQSKLQQDSVGLGGAAAELLDRLAQFGRQIEQLRAALPGAQAQTLVGVEQGIAYLAKRVAAIDRDQPTHDAPRTAPAPAAQAQLDEPWDAESAEALMRAYEAAEAEFARGPCPAGAETREAPGPREAPASDPATPGDQAWLDARLSAMSAMLQQAVAEMNPSRSLATLDWRLDQFEQRLDAALSDMATPAADRLSRLEAHVGELATHLEAACRQLERLDAMDGRLRDLALALRHRQVEPAPLHLTEDDVAALVDTAAERAVKRLSEGLPGAGPGQVADELGRIGSLEGLLKDYMAERRRSDVATGGILYTIEGALTRLAGRVDTVETSSPVPRSGPADDAVERDGVELESERLAEAYAAGARALGAEPPGSGSTLDAADYVAPALRADAGFTTEAEPAVFPPPVRDAPDPDPAEAQTRQELRASVMRAKLEQVPLERRAEPADDAVDEDRRPVHPGRGRRHWSGLLLAAAMALMCGTGFLLVDSLLAGPPVSGMNEATGVPPAQIDTPPARWNLHRPPRS